MVTRPVMASRASAIRLNWRIVVIVISGCRQSKSAIMSGIGFCRSSVAGVCKIPNGTTKASFVPPQFLRRYCLIEKDQDGASQIVKAFFEWLNVFGGVLAQNDFRLPSSLYEFPYRFTQRFKPLTTCVVLVVNLHKPFGLIGVCRAIEGLVRKSPCVSCLAKLILELQRQKPQALGKLILTRLLCFGSRSSSLVRLVAAHVVWQTRGQTPLRRSGPL